MVTADVHTTQHYHYYCYDEWILLTIYTRAYIILLRTLQYWGVWTAWTAWVKCYWLQKLVCRVASVPFATKRLYRVQIKRVSWTVSRFTCNGCGFCMQTARVGLSMCVCVYDSRVLIPYTWRDTRVNNNERRTRLTDTASRTLDFQAKSVSSANICHQQGPVTGRVKGSMRGIPRWTVLRLV